MDLGGVRLKTGVGKDLNTHRSFTGKGTRCSRKFSGRLLDGTDVTIQMTANEISPIFIK